MKNKICKKCDKEFIAKDNRTVFCSKSCSAKFNNVGVRRHGKDPKLCLVCGKETRNLKFCSRSCSAKSQRIDRFSNITKTSNENNFFSHTTMKSYLLHIGESKCSSCGMDSWMGNPMPLELHHKNGISKDNRLSNLEILCPNCHAFTDNYKAKNKCGDRNLSVYYHRNRSARIPSVL